MYQFFFSYLYFIFIYEDAKINPLKGISISKNLCSADFYGEKHNIGGQNKTIYSDFDRFKPY